MNWPFAVFNPFFQIFEVALNSNAIYWTLKETQNDCKHCLILQVIQQLQLMGEVIYVKGSVCVDVIILEPKWLSHQILGQIMSPNFVRKSKMAKSGFYTASELRSITSWEAVENILPILESLGLCAKVSYLQCTVVWLFRQLVK